MKPGNIGKLVHELIPEKILLGIAPLRNWYDGNPYRKFNVTTNDSYGREVQMDVLVLKNPDSDIAYSRPVIVVTGYDISRPEKKLIGTYSTRIHFDIDKEFYNCCDASLDGAELSLDGMRASFSKRFLKSDLEKHYRKFATVSELTEKVLMEAANSYSEEENIFGEELYRHVLTVCYKVSNDRKFIH